jgi:hypothetical protein
MLESTVAFTLFEKVLDGIRSIRKGKKERTEKIDQALLALYAALGESRAYQTDIESGKRRNKKREFEIAKLWHIASIPLREIDPEFAGRCFIKGSYWMEPETWNKKLLQEKGVDFETALEETRKLLVG